MTLVAGSRLGPYEILSAVGAGGMGEVCRARDTRLERTVAVRVLPRFLVMVSVDESPFLPPTVVLNWASELAKS